MKISYVSDVHLEFLKYPNFSNEQGGDILILAGDILTANLLRENREDAESRKLKKYVKTTFKKDLLDKYKQVIYVMGNHEHYNYVFDKTIPTIKSFFEKNNINNVFIMNNDHYVYKDIVFIGSTLWTDFNKSNPITMFDVQRGMNDYRIIYQNDDMLPITPDFILKEHNSSIKYIKHIVNHYNRFPCVIVTHMAPSLESIDLRHSDSLLNYAYASDLSDFINKNTNIKYWIYGHTHGRKEYQIGDCKVLSNCVGYYFEKDYSKFTGLKCFEV